MAPEMSTQTVDPDYARAAAVSQPSSPTRAPAATHQPAEQQGTFATTNTNTYNQQQQQQGQFQAAYFQQDPRAYGQPFQPYAAPGTQVMTQQQYQQQFQQQPQNGPNAVTAWVNAKVGMRIFSIIICICAIAISFSLPGSGGYAFVLCTPLFFLALVWDIAEITTWLLRKRHAGIHPGAHVGVSLILWMAAATVGGIQCTYVAFVIYDTEDYSSNTCWNSELQEYITCGDSDDPYGPVRARFLTVAVFACLVWLVHFTLFVSACIETAKRNAAMRRVMVVAPPYWGQAYQGWQPMPQQQQQQQHMASGALNMTTVQPPQSIPLQNRSPAPEDNDGSSKEAARGESSTRPAAGGITEYYTPSSR